MDLSGQMLLNAGHSQQCRGSGLVLTESETDIKPDPTEPRVQVLKYWPFPGSGEKKTRIQISGSQVQAIDSSVADPGWY